MVVHQCIQGSEEWLQLRLGVVTSSEFHHIITPKKLQLAEKASTLMHRLLAEWMYGAPLEAFVSKWQERGKELEPEAVRKYELDKDVETQAIGFVSADDGMSGASPDRLIGEVGLYEGKAPGLQAHVGYLLDPQSLLEEYRIQHQGQHWVCKDREWVDMHSYHPGFPSVIVRTYRDEPVQCAIDQHIPAFVATMLECRVKLLAKYGELRRERLGAAKAAEILESRRAAHDEWMDSPVGGVV